MDNTGFVRRAESIPLYPAVYPRKKRLSAIRQKDRRQPPFFVMLRMPQSFLRARAILYQSVPAARSIAVIACGMWDAVSPAVWEIGLEADCAISPASPAIYAPHATTFGVGAL